MTTAEPIQRSATLWRQIKDAVLEDIDEPWPTRRLPSHRIDEE